VTGPLDPRSASGYHGHTMPLPDWAADAVAKVLNRDSLVLLEGRHLKLAEDRGGLPVLLLAQLGYLETENRLEVQPVAIILDERLARQLVEGTESVVYNLPGDDPG
jgi:hypothetical protein